MTIADFESRLNVLEQEVSALRQELEKERVREGLRIGRAQADRGEGFPAREALEALRQK